MKIEIETADGGYIVTNIDPDSDESRKVICTTVVEMLHTVNELIGEIGSRYDNKRIYIIEAPGDKNEAFTEEHSKVIWGDNFDN